MTIACLPALTWNCIEEFTFYLMPLDTQTAYWYSLLNLRGQYMKKLIIVLALLFNYSPTYAVVNTGADLIEKCDSYISYMGNKDIPDSNFAYAMGICMGFVDGVVLYP